MNDDALKQSLRALCLTRRKQLSCAEQAAASETVCEQIKTLECYQNATHIAIYHAVNGEIDLTRLQGKTICFPVMQADQTLLFLPVTQHTVFYKNRFGIPEPDIKPELALSPSQLDLIFLPLVAFDEHGTRLGMGGGYYDRTLAHHRPPALLIGVGYDFQRQDVMKRQSWDVPVAAVITERHIYWSKS